MEAQGYARPGKDKCFCPWHQDRKPSAYKNLNNIYCFSCCRVYSLRDFETSFGVVLDHVPEEEATRQSGKLGYAYDQVLFEYPFKVEEGVCC